MNETGKYDDILHLPRPEPKLHHRMSMTERAAQFSPFAALTGYDDAVREKARLTQKKQELDEDAKEELDRRLQLLEAWKDEQLPVRITYFQQDLHKEGGEYLSVCGSVQRFDRLEQEIRMSDGTQIAIGDLYAIEGSVFDLADGIQN